MFRHTTSKCVVRIGWSSEGHWVVRQLFEGEFDKCPTWSWSRRSQVQQPEKMNAKKCDAEDNKDSEGWTHQQVENTPKKAALHPTRLKMSIHWVAANWGNKEGSDTKNFVPNLKEIPILACLLLLNNPVQKKKKKSWQKHEHFNWINYFHI